MNIDAARLLFMPPLLPPESSNSANAVDSEKSGGAENLRCGKNLLPVFITLLDFMPQGNQLIG